MLQEQTILSQTIFTYLFLIVKLNYVIFNKKLLLQEVDIMNTQQLKCFLAVAENLNYAKAAQELYLTQPTVTHQINSLESELGVRLFYRTKHTVSLTQEGMIFYEDARAILVREQIAVSKLRFQGTLTEPFVSFGFASTTEMNNFIPVLSRLAKAASFHPYLRIVPRKSIWSMFQSTDLDCIFSYKGSFDELPKIGIEDIMTVNNVCLVPKDHALSGKEKVSADELTDSRFIFCNPAVLPSAAASLENELLAYFPPDQICNCESVEAAVALVHSGYGVAMLPDNLCGTSDMAVRVPFNTDLSMTYCMFWKKEMSETKKEIIKMIKEIMT